MVGWCSDTLTMIGMWILIGIPKRERGAVIKSTAITLTKLIFKRCWNPSKYNTAS